jgi:hypothetical protein
VLDEVSVDSEGEPIAGGTVTPPGVHESVGLLGGGCSASLVAPDVVLTAAHCVCNDIEPFNCRTRSSLTLHNVFRVDDPSTPVDEGAVRSDVTIAGSVVVHPLYGRFGWLRHDYALVRLDQRATDLARVTPLRVEGGRLPPIGEPLTLVGYGYTNGPDGECSTGIGTKRTTVLPVTSITDQGGGSLVIGLVHADRHVCPGDSGGPVIDGAGRILGVCSESDLDTNSGYDATAAVTAWLAENGVAVPGEGYDRKAGILWRNTSGAVALWFMEGGTISAERYPGTADGSWQIQGTGDFDGDGGGDVLWRQTSGQVAIWYMAGGVRLGEAYPGGQDPGLFWAIQGVGDFDADGRSDILWRGRDGNLAIWFHGDNASAVYLAAADLSWQVKGAGDFNGDGRSDILWRRTDGQVAIWYMAGGTRIGEAYPGGQDPGLFWNIQGVGDFDASGSSDILWRDRNGHLALWFNGSDGGAAYPSYQNGSGPVDVAWQVQGVGDFDGDDRADILWRHVDGLVGIWRMNGGLFVSDVYPRQVETSWAIEGLVAPR